jgi:hypothetical protein
MEKSCIKYYVNYERKISDSDSVDSILHVQCNWFMNSIFPLFVSRKTFFYARFEVHYFVNNLQHLIVESIYFIHMSTVAIYLSIHHLFI